MEGVSQMPVELLYGLGTLIGGLVGHLYNQKGMLVWPSRIVTGVWNLGFLYEILLGIGAALGVLVFFAKFDFGLDFPVMPETTWSGVGFIVGFTGPAIIGTIKSKFDVFWPLANRGVNQKLNEIDDLSHYLSDQVAPEQDHTPVARTLAEKVDELILLMQDVKPEEKSSN